jgi:hypothetical protein
MSKTREEQLVLEGTAYDNFINAVRSKSSQKFYLVGLKKFNSQVRLKIECQKLKIMYRLQDTSMIQKEIV